MYILLIGSDMNVHFQWQTKCHPRHKGDNKETKKKERRSCRTSLDESSVGAKWGAVANSWLSARNSLATIAKALRWDPMKSIRYLERLLTFGARAFRLPNWKRLRLVFAVLICRHEKSLFDLLFNHLLLKPVADVGPKVIPNK